MKAKLKLVLTMAIFFLFLVSCTKTKISEKVEWRGEIEYENGVKVVKNPAEPVYGEMLLDLEEDLAVGREDDDNYMFYRVRKIDVDDQGNIYVLEGGNCRLQKFDPDGQYLQTIGKKGQGPGEFERPSKLSLGEENNIYISEYRKIHIFNGKGKFINSILLSDFITDFSIASDKSIFGIASIRSDVESKQCFVKLDHKGKMIKNIAQFDYPAKLVQRKGTDGTTMAFGLSHQYNQDLYFSRAVADKHIYAYSSKYSLFQVNLEGDLELIIKKEEPAHSISQKEKNKIYESYSRLEERWPKGVVKEAIQFPSHRPYFNRILTDDRGRIYVRRVRSVIDESEEVEFDIFSKEGHYLYKTNLPFTPSVIKNGYFYEHYSSEETGEVKIKRYKAKNWEKITDGI
ncbi:MAG: 6-bladed beta-propeller [Candidatus Aminicenantes bacterium]|nr:6-bladed beta-propeller [Candidatus Aminicenantes bacterium]